MAEIGKSIQYINKIVGDLQDYARPITPAAKEIDLEDVIREVLAKTDFPQNIKTSCDVKKDAKKFVSDPDLLKRMLGNLVINAVQSMPNGGDLCINAYMEPDTVVLTVEDTGVGIPEGIRPKLFTPLFTTKSKGQGFGLAVVKRMTDALAGTITYKSQKDKGTKFVIRLPLPKNNPLTKIHSARFSDSCLERTQRQSSFHKLDSHRFLVKAVVHDVSNEKLKI